MGQLGPVKKLCIVDVANLFFRAYWGVEMLVNSKGQPVNALQGFVNSLTHILEKIKPDLIALALESRTPSFRKSLSQEYKANRSEPPDELKSQLNLLPDLLKALNYPVFQKDGFEGDDIIGTLATIGADSGANVVIVSGDKDFCQLITEKTVIFDVAKETYITKNDVMNKYGVFPEQFIDYLAIVGDSSDGFKGVEGIGPKGASKLLQQYGTLSNIYSHISEIKGAGQTKLIKSEKSAYLSQTLAKIVRDVPLTNMCIDDTLVFKGHNTELLKKFFVEHELRFLYNSFFGSEVNEFGIGKSIY
jgi:DNA polymerase-1